MGPATTHYIISILAPDRVGIIAGVSRPIYELGGNLEAMTSVCSVGLDMIVIPGDTDSDTIAAIIADEMAIGIINHKTTAVRVIPAPGKAAGDWAVFGGLFGQGCAIEVRNAGCSSRFVAFGGRIPAPLQSLNN